MLKDFCQLNTVETGTANHYQLRQPDALTALSYMRTIPPCLFYRCDPRCHYFGECCIDAKESETPVRLLEYFCVEFAKFNLLGHALIKSCPVGTPKHLMVSCTEGVAETWSPLGWPVSDVNTKLRYEYPCLSVERLINFGKP